MTATYGSQSMVARLRRVLVRTPDESFGSASPGRWHYVGQPSLPDAQTEHRALVQLMEDAGVEIIYHNRPSEHLADAIYVHDPAIVVDQGAILLRMGKALRSPEPELMAPCLESAGVPIHYRLHGEALAEYAVE